MWAIKPGAPYSVTPGYSRSIPLATKPPPLPTGLKRKIQPSVAPRAKASAPRVAASPYSVTPGYDVSSRRIPIATAPPRMPKARAPMPSLASQRRAPRGPAPPRMPPPRHLQQVVRIPPSVQGLQAPQPQAWPEEPQEPPDPPLRLELPPDAGFVSDGLSPEGWAVYVDSRLQYVSGSVSHLMQEFVEDPASEVAIEHDADWELFPEVAEALKQAGGSEASICVAFCHSHGAWGVGVGGKWKKREAAAQLALCLALVQSHADPDAIFESYPEFADFCQVQQPSKKKRKKAKAVPKQAAVAMRAVKSEAHMYEPPVEPESEGFPKEVPVWIKLPDAPMPDQLDGLLPEALAVGTDGTKRKSLYANVDKVIADLIPDPEAEIMYHDDADWKDFPSVGQALKEIADKEECFCVAVCPSRSVWAVGVGMRGKARWMAAKVAMAASLLWQASEAGEELPEIENQAMLDFVQEVQQAREEVGW